jgi:citrate lyase subunit beta/citryl-CoA lyase
MPDQSTSEEHVQLLRSLMFTPGQRRNMIDKALGLGAAGPDALMFDFEDSVPPDQKDVARDLVAEALTHPPGADGPAYIVRVNSSATGRQIADMRAVVGPHLFAILLPKVERPDEIVAAAMVVDDLERESGVPRGQVGLIAAIESARGVHRVVDIATSSPRLAGLMFGAEDYARDLGLPVVRTGAAWELIFARSSLVNSAAIARLFTMDQVHMNFRDTEGERRDAIASRAVGFSGKCAIHPSQVAIINEVFSPTPEEVEHARAVAKAFDEAVAKGVGCVMFGGQVVEQPILERAQRVLRYHETIEARRLRARRATA